MGIFRQFPYSNFHDMNLDWLLTNMQDLENKWDKFIVNWGKEVKEEVDNWLVAHPEYTTTVMDGSLTAQKFTNELQLLTLKDYVTPEMFGAIGDGIANDTAPIQEALDSGKNVLLLQNYLIVNSLKYKSNTIINGWHKGSLILADNLTQVVKSMLVPFEDNVHDVVITGIVFDQRSDVYGNNDSSYCISVNCTNNVTISNCIFKNIQTMAIWCDERDYSTDNLTIKNNIITNSEADGFSLFGACENIKIIGNIITHSKDDAIAIQGISSVDKYPKHCIIKNNIIKRCSTQGDNGSTPHGILSHGCSGILIDNNYIDGTYAAGIRVYTYSKTGISEFNADTIISNNVIKNAGENNTGSATASPGISFSGTPSTYMLNAVIEGNAIDTTWNDGISVSRCKQVIVSNNNCSNCGGPGIYESNSENVSISCNKIYKGGTRVNKSSIFLNAGSSIDIFANHCSGGDNTYGITIMTGATGITVRWNTFKDCDNANTVENYVSTNASFIGNIYKAGNPYRVKVTLEPSVYYTDITGINASNIKRGIIIVTPLNDSAGALLANGYAVAEFNNGVNLHTMSASVGTEEIEVTVI